MSLKENDVATTATYSSMLTSVTVKVVADIKRHRLYYSQP